MFIIQCKSRKISEDPVRIFVLIGIVSFVLIYPIYNKFFPRKRKVEENINKSVDSQSKEEEVDSQSRHKEVDSQSGDKESVNSQSGDKESVNSQSGDKESVDSQSRHKVVNSQSRHKEVDSQSRHKESIIFRKLSMEESEIKQDDQNDQGADRKGSLSQEMNGSNYVWQTSSQILKRKNDPKHDPEPVSQEEQENFNKAIDKYKKNAEKVKIVTVDENGKQFQKTDSYIYYQNFGLQENGQENGNSDLYLVCATCKEKACTCSNNNGESSQSNQGFSICCSCGWNVIECACICKICKSTNCQCKNNSVISNQNSSIKEDIVKYAANV